MNNGITAKRYYSQTGKPWNRKTGKPENIDKINKKTGVTNYGWA